MSKPNAKLSTRHLKLPSLPLLTPLWRQTFSGEVLAADSCRLTGIRPQNSSTNFVDFTCALLHFYKVVRLFSKKYHDALISWYIMRLQNPAIPVSPLFSAGRKQHELRSKQCSHECNSIGRIWLGSCFSKSKALMFPFQTTQNHT